MCLAESTQHQHVMERWTGEHTDRQIDNSEFHMIQLHKAQSHRTATFGDFKLGLVAGDHSAVAFDRGHTKTQVATDHSVFARLEISIARLYSEYTATVLRLQENDCDHS